MTKEDFFAKRAVAHHVKTVGITHVPAGAVVDEDAFTVRRKSRVRFGMKVAVRIVSHPLDDSGAPVPIRSRSFDDYR